MIAVRRGGERQHDQRRNRDVWRTFLPEAEGSAPSDRFGALELLDEDRLAPGAGVPRHPVPRDPGREAEIVTYVREGALAYEDSTGRSGVIHAGEFHRMTGGCGIRHSEANASRTDSAHVFQIHLRPSRAGLGNGHEQKRFTAAERRGVLCAIASLDARRGSLRLHHDALIYSALLYPGQHVVHELTAGRSAWLHIVQGEVLLGDVVLTGGDGAGLTAERAVSLTAGDATEILLLELGPPAGPSTAGVAA